MGEWSEYFEDFPEENSANYVNGRFDPKGAEALRAGEAKLLQDQANLDAEIRAIVQKHRAAAGNK
ncbi:hypothetical protein MNJPNG_08975 [Cupriavidus oxalaticus]|uniref:hypothetical protein n=1 Tax=Cupriavidus oxalaticus TaxID=96344 RepID=UPI003F737ACC